MSKYISFIAPMYNMEKYIDDFMLSFKNLPKDKYELIVVDNASTDNSLSKAIEYKNLLNLKVVESKENLAVGLGRNKGLESISSKTTHIIYIDPDDALIDNLDFDKILSFCDDSIKININQLEWTTRKIIKSRLPKYEPYKGSGVHVAWGNIYPVWAKDWKFTVKFYEDFAWSANITSKNKFELIDYPFIKVRRRKSSITNSIAKFPNRLNDFKEEVLRMINEDLFEDKIGGQKISKQRIFDIYVLEGYARGYKNITWDERFNFLQINKQKVFWTVFFQKLVRFWWWYSKFGMRNYFK